MTEDEILKAWRAAIKPSERVRHGADWVLGTVVGKSPHPVYDLDVEFSDAFGISPVYVRNLFLEWWPAPEWVAKEKAPARKTP